jgi:diketogulonate reductase-like aldo/keto reductase
MQSTPTFLYGTAWKEERTGDLVRQALRAGFRGIDTANQRRHYFEAAVGEGIAGFLEESGLAREDLFLQTKFTFAPGQDHRLPYDPKASYAEQVRQSFESSLEHLKTTYLDSYVLHGPMYRDGLSDEDWEAWRAIEALARDGRTRLVGVSNVSLEQLGELCDGAALKPAFVQNRCFARTGWDRAVRRYCKEQGIVYQGFSLLTANVVELGHPSIHALAARLGATLPQLVFRFAQQVGMLPLTGTTNEDHMRADLACDAFTLAPSDLELIETVALSRA